MTSAGGGVTEPKTTEQTGKGTLNYRNLQIQDPRTTLAVVVRNPDPDGSKKSRTTLVNILRLGDSIPLLQLA